MTDFSSAKNIDLPCISLARTSLADRPLILVVEDHEDTRFLLRVFLERGGMRVIEAADGEAGLRIADEHRPDLILMDCSLPLLDGIAATRLLHESAGLRDIPICVLSGHADAASQKSAREAGCCEYLVKPLDFDHLDRVLHKYLVPRVASATAGPAAIS